MGFCQAPYVWRDEPAYTSLTLCMQGWLCIHGPQIKKPLADLLRYKSSHLGPKPSPMYFQPKEHFFEVYQWQKTLLLMSPLGSRSLVPNLSIFLLPMAFLTSSLTINLGWMSLFFMLLPTIVPSWHVFRFNGIELCPTIKDFAVIMGESEIDDLIFSTMSGDLRSLLQFVLGVPKTTANR